MAMRLLFGGKGRLGNNLGYIREGSESASIACTLNNDCPTPFEPEKYGSSIKIQVTITKKIDSRTGKTAAQVQYQTKSAQNRKIATSKKAILEIASHYNIAIDN